jgi:hypothetical protein
VRASDYHRASAIDPSQIVTTRSIRGQTVQVLQVQDHRYRLVENGTIVAPGIDPSPADRPPTARETRAFLHPRKQTFAAPMDQYRIRANNDYPYEDTYDALHNPAAIGR